MKNSTACKRYIERHEGRRAEVYLDTKRHPTIGVGFNLDRSDAPIAIRKLRGVDYQELKHGEARLNKEQIDTLFENDLKTAIQGAKKFYPGFDSLDPMRQIVLVDMSFNMGYEKLKEFKKLQAAMEAKDYKTAAQEMGNSHWAKQVGVRADANISAMREGHMPYKEIELKKESHEEKTEEIKLQEESKSGRNMSPFPQRLSC